MHTPLGDAPLSGRIRQALEHAGAPRELIIGIRPEAFEDASLVTADARESGIVFRAAIDVLESMGSDVFVYFTKEIERGVDAAELAELARDSGRADTGGGGDTLVARNQPGSPHTRGGHPVVLGHALLLLPLYPS